MKKISWGFLLEWYTFINNFFLTSPSSSFFLFNLIKKPSGGNIIAHTSTTRLRLRKGRGEIVSVLSLIAQYCQKEMLNLLLSQWNLSFYRLVTLFLYVSATVRNGIRGHDDDDDESSMSMNWQGCYLWTSIIKNRQEKRAREKSISSLFVIVVNMFAIRIVIIYNGIHRNLYYY